MPSLRLFPNTIPARFIERPNRFLVLCDCEGERVSAFLPNPGRLRELLLPGVRLHLVRTEPVPGRRTSLTVVAVEREGRMVMLHTHRTNDVARFLLERGLVPGLETARILRGEAPRGRSRFDFLLDHEGARTYLEVKSVTLFGERIAMFPDAVTARGARHLHELKALSLEGVGTAVLFVIHWPHAELFMPDFHTDPAFANAFLAMRGHVPMIPLAVEWGPDLALAEEAKLLTIPWEYIEEEAKDRGSYLLILRMEEDREIPVGSLGRVPFREGYYVYVGSAMANLAKRTGRHERLRKKHHWHIDMLRAVSELRAVLPIRASARLECDIARALTQIADWTIEGFGASDCACPTHLFAMKADPLTDRRFLDVLQYFRIDRLSADWGREAMGYRRWGRDRKPEIGK